MLTNQQLSTLSSTTFCHPLNLTLQKFLVYPPTFVLTDLPGGFARSRGWGLRTEQNFFAWVALNLTLSGVGLSVDVE